MINQVGYYALLGGVFLGIKIKGSKEEIFVEEIPVDNFQQGFFEGYHRDLFTKTLYKFFDQIIIKEKILPKRVLIPKDPLFDQFQKLLKNLNYNVIRNDKPKELERELAPYYVRSIKGTKYRFYKHVLSRHVRHRFYDLIEWLQENPDRLIYVKTDLDLWRKKGEPRFKCHTLL